MATDRRETPLIQDKIFDKDNQFIESTNIGCVIRDVLGKIIAIRPEDPVSFIAEYFETLLEDNRSLVHQAIHVVTTTHYDHPSFEVDISESYNILSKYKVSKKLSGVNGAVFTEFLQDLCGPLPSVVTSKVLKKLHCFAYEAVTYDIYRSSVFTCSILIEFASVAKELFSSLDINKNGRVDVTLCKVVLDQLTTALCCCHNDVKRMIESSYSLAVECLQPAFERVYSQEKSNGFYTSDHFVAETCEAFLSKIRKLR